MRVVPEQAPICGCCPYFPQCEALIPRLRNPPEGTSVEVLLEAFGAQAAGYPERYSQLAAVRYYLHFLLWELGRHWETIHRGVTNYRTLLDDIERWRFSKTENVCLVSFNYDKILDSALAKSGINIQNLSDYIANKNYKLIKIHGSVDWGHEVQNHAELGIDLQRMNAWEITVQLIREAADLKFTERYHVVTSLPIAKWEDSARVAAIFPAIALPVTKKSTFECPEEHLRCLKECLPMVTKILTIGWRGQEEHFLELLRKHLGPRPRMMIVAGGRDEANQIGNNLVTAEIGSDVVAAKGGFTDAIRNDETTPFLWS